MVGVVLLAICVSISAVSADDGWSFNFSSSEGSNSDGGSVSFDNGKLVLQDIEFAIPDGYKENDTAQKLAEQAEDDEDAKYSLCSFLNGDKEIVVKVFFSDNLITKTSLLLTALKTKPLQDMTESTMKTHMVTTLLHSSLSKKVNLLK